MSRKTEDKEMLSKLKKGKAKMQAAPLVGKAVSAKESPFAYQGVRVFTPDEAQDILDNRNKDNRAMKEAVARRYANDMVRGTFDVTHQGIAFNEEGFVVDGQTRLKGVVIANKPVTLQVSIYKGNKTALLLPIDNGKIRTRADIAHVAKTEADTITAILASLYTSHKYMEPKYLSALHKQMNKELLLTHTIVTGEYTKEKRLLAGVRCAAVRAAVMYAAIRKHNWFAKYKQLLDAGYNDDDYINRIRYYIEDNRGTQVSAQKRAMFGAMLSIIEDGTLPSTIDENVIDAKIMEARKHFEQTYKDILIL